MIYTFILIFSYISHYYISFIQSDYLKKKLLTLLSNFYQTTHDIPAPEYHGKKNLLYLLSR